MERLAAFEKRLIFSLKTFIILDLIFHNVFFSTLFCIPSIPYSGFGSYLSNLSSICSPRFYSSNLTMSTCLKLEYIISFLVFKLFIYFIVTILKNLNTIEILYLSSINFLVD